MGVHNSFVNDLWICYSLSLSKDEDGDKDTQNTQRIENTETVSGIAGIDW